MNDRFSVNELIYRANKRRSESGESNLEAQDYGEILDKLQRIIAKNHSAELAQVFIRRKPRASSRTSSCAT